MKHTFYILLLIGIFFYMAKTHVTMHPFSIKFENLKYAFGWVLLAGGITLLVLSSYENGVKVGADSVRDEVIKYIDSLEKTENK